MRRGCQAALILLLAAGPAGSGPAADADNPTSETSGQVSWVDPQARAFGIETDEQELEFVTDDATVILRDGKPSRLEEVQPGDWAAACVYRLRGDQRLCVRLEILTPPEEEGLE
jgi:hypothetical protein